MGGLKWVLRRIMRSDVAFDGLMGDLVELRADVRTRRGAVVAWVWMVRELLVAIGRYALGRGRTGEATKPPSGRTRWVEAVGRDLRYAVRLLWRAPGFTVVSVATIALGIAATTTVFSVADAVILEPPPGVRHADELVTVHRIAEDGSSFHAFSYPNYADFRDGDNGLEELAAFSVVPVSLSRDDQADLIFGLFVTANYFETLGARPALGRFFAPGEDAPGGGGEVAVLSHRAWTERFGADSAIVGRTITVNRSVFTVIGVAEVGFSGHVTLFDIGVWLPLSASERLRGEDLTARNFVFLETIGRRASGASLADTRAAMDVIADQLAVAYPAVNRGAGVDVRPYGNFVPSGLGAVRAFMALLFVVAGIVLLIASVNVGGMLLARATRRRREVALRLAIGAGRGRVVRQLLTESLVLFLLGGGVGTGLSFLATSALSAFRPPIPVPVVFAFHPDGGALLFTLTLSLVTGLVFGLAPALQVTRPDLGTVLKDGSGASSRGRLRQAFVVVQVTGSVVLLVGAGLFTRAIARADAIDLGFQPSGLHVLSTDLTVHNYTPEEAEGFYADLVERVDALPGIERFSLIDMLPLSGANQTSILLAGDGDPADRRAWAGTDFARVGPGYFGTVRTPLVAGRDFDESDRKGAPLVAIVNETVARRYWPGGSAVGQRLRFGSRRDPMELEVVGVVADARYRSFSDEGRNMVFVPYAQQPTDRMTVIARVSAGGPPVAPALREAVRTLDPALPLELNTAYEVVMGIALLPNRAAAVLASGFGLIGLLLAGVGLYGLLSYAVTQRTREIGIRLALGAEAKSVRRLVLRDGLRLVGLGLGVGAATALAVSGLLRGMLFGLSPLDPVTLGGISALLLVTGLVASALPARRAIRTDPVTALREE